MAKLIQQERLEEAATYRRWNGHRRLGFQRLVAETMSPEPRPADKGREVEMRQKAS